MHFFLKKSSQCLKKRPQESRLLLKSTSKNYQQVMEAKCKEMMGSLRFLYCTVGKEALLTSSVSSKCKIFNYEIFHYIGYK